MLNSIGFICQRLCNLNLCQEQNFHVAALRRKRKKQRPACRTLPISVSDVEFLFIVHSEIFGRSFHLAAAGEFSEQDNTAIIWPQVVCNGDPDAVFRVAQISVNMIESSATNHLPSAFLLYILRGAL